ncbi:MAG TPA: hypothetical protein VIY27_00675 [Myxococcota bacterium]
MANSRRCAVSAVAAALFVFAADPEVARAEPSANFALARAILSDLGMEPEIEAVAQEAAAYLDARRGYIAPSDREPLRAVIKAGFRPETLYALTLDGFLERYEPQHAAATAAWLGRPETRALLERGREVEPTARCRPETALHKLSRVRRIERLSLVARIGRDTSASARAARRAALLFGSMLRAGNAALPESDRFTRAEIEQMIAAQRDDLAAAYATSSRALDCAYRGVGLETLRETARFLDGEAGRWMLDSVDGALEQALMRAAEATALMVVRTFGTGARPNAVLRSARALPGDPGRVPFSEAEPPRVEHSRSAYATGAIPAQLP